MPQFETNPRDKVNMVTANAGHIRMKVVETFVSSPPVGNNADPQYILRCHLWDGTNEGTKDYFVARAIGVRAGTTINAYQVDTGLNYKNAKVTWKALLILPDNPRKWDVLICVDDNGTIVWDRPRFTNLRGEDRAQP